MWLLLQLRPLSAEHVTSRLQFSNWKATALSTLARFWSCSTHALQRTPSSSTMKNLKLTSFCKPISLGELLILEPQFTLDTLTQYLWQGSRLEITTDKFVVRRLPTKCSYCRTHQNCLSDALSALVTKSHWLETWFSVVIVGDLMVICILLTGRDGELNSHRGRCDAIHMLHNRRSNNVGCIKSIRFTV